MATIRLLLVLCVVPYCLGSGGAAAGSGGGSVPIGTSDVPENVKLINVGKALKFNCTSAGPEGTKYEYDWYKGTTQVVTEEGVVDAFINGTLVYHKATKEEVGNYTCKPRKGGQEQTYTAIIISYKKMSKSGIAIEEDKLTLSCEAEGIPTPTITWTKDNVSIEEAVEAERLSFPEPSNDKLPPYSLLEISNVKKTDRGEYTCYITNYEGLVFSTYSFIRVKDIYAALWPFLGIVAEVVILCLVIFIYEKRRSKNDFEESDTDQGASTKGGRT